MNNTKLYQLLAALPRDEHPALRAYWRSAYFNSREVLVRLGELLLPAIQTGSRVDRKSLFSALYPAEAYSDQRFRLLCSDLLRLTEGFLQQQAFAAEPLRREVQLLSAYRRLDLSRHAAAVERRLNQAMSLPYGDDSYHLQREKLEWERYHRLSRESRSTTFDWRQLTVHLEAAFLIARLRQAAYAQAYRTVNPEADRADPLLAFCLQYVEREKRFEHPGIGLYYHIYRALQSPAEDRHFQPFRQLLLDHSSLFSAEEARDLLLLAANYCIRRVNDGEPRFLSEGLELYRTGLDTEVLLRDGQLSRFTYNNIVALALRKGEIDWAANFIETYRDRLASAYRDSTYAFNRARLAYEQRNLTEAMEHLRHAEPKDQLNSLIIKTLQIRVYYELGEISLLDSHLDAMSIYLRRRKVLGYHRKNYRNIIDYTRKLLRLSPYDAAARDRLCRAIEAEPVLTERAWLLRMVDR